jgi:hypothetical protein
VPDGVDVVGVVLGVIVLDQERRSVQAIVMPLSSLQTTSPGKANVMWIAGWFRGGRCGALCGSLSRCLPTRF